MDHIPTPFPCVSHSESLLNDPWLHLADINSLMARQSEPFTSLLTVDALLNLSASSLLAADAFLNLVASPNSPFVHGTQNHYIPHFASPPSNCYDKEHALLTPIQALFSSAGEYWEGINPVSPILRTSSPTTGIQQNTNPGSACTRCTDATRLAGLSPLSPVPSLSNSSSVSHPDTIPFAPSTSSAPQPLARAPSPDWEPLGGFQIASASSHGAAAAEKAFSPPSSTRKRVKRPHVDAPGPMKRRRLSTDTTATANDTDADVVFPRRTFPSYVALDDQFSLLYRKFPVCSYTRRGKRGVSPHHSLDPLFSLAYMISYHMIHMHCIMPASGRPFSPPVDFRTIKCDNVGKNKKTHLRQGKCHKWHKWKHAHSCHRGSRIPGEADDFVEADVLRAALTGELDDDLDEDEEEENGAYVYILLYYPTAILSRPVQFSDLVRLLCFCFSSSMIIIGLALAFVVALVLLILSLRYISFPYTYRLSPYPITKTYVCIYTGPLAHYGLRNDDHEERQVLAPRRNITLPKVQIAVLLIAYFAQPVAITIIYPFIPKLVMELHLVDGDTSKVGYYSGLFDALPLLSEAIVVLYWTRFSDIYGRRRVLLCGAAGLACSLTCFGLSKTLVTLVLSRTLQGAMDANTATIKTMLGEIADGDEAVMARLFSLLPIVWASGSTLA
ncbi:hypothetical protein EUX98_g5491 [Antrodiella citrinella]|uniref:Major facilitator superfamily (MFS) profile domain-containing protein n=1 Tax=Antrodiella citrinella TaxID=2447956 RepID=A0A4S4MRH3_9APHY|nr:hypothetical protein EUX98_g5491 [Antrodiella citrinella]